MKCCALILIALGCVSAVHASDWPQFRGPNADGAYAGPKLPTEWGTNTNVTWKTPIPGQGWSSPIVSKGKIYLTTAVAAPGGGGYSLRAICVDAGNGKIDWNKEVFVEDAKAPKIHAKNSHASPTPITDGERVYVHFGHMGTAALDLKGEIVWAKTDLKYLPQHGNGGSPILAGDNLVFSIDGNDMQVMVARNKSTGAIAWKTERNGIKGVNKFSFSTPLLVTTGKREQVVSPSSGFVASYDPKSGKEIWRAAYQTNGYSVIPQPVLGPGLIYVSTSYNTPWLLAFKPEGQGDVTTSNLAWSLKKNAPHTPTPILVGNELYLLADNGNFTCVDAKSGTVHWSQRLSGNYSASPIVADGKIYIINETGTGFVVAASKEEYKEISQSKLGEKTLATFAAADGALYIRTETQLYRFDTPK